MKARSFRGKIASGRLERALLTIGFSVFAVVAGCSRKGDSPVPSASSKIPAAQDARQTPSDDYDREIRAALADAAKSRDEKLRNRPTNEVALPNFDTGPMRPLPLGRNFYRIDKARPSYLLCTYHVYENHYDTSNEPTWLEEALMQVRWHGQDRFPPIQWVAVVIVNRADTKTGSAPEQSFKVGAIFNAREIFNIEHDLESSIRMAEADRRPVKYPVGSKLGQRWIFVERHAATNQTVAP